MTRVFFSRDHSSNTYVLDGISTIIIDGGCDRNLPKSIAGVYDTQSSLINTHCHFDHTANNRLLVEELGFSLCVHADDADAIEEGIDRLVLASAFGQIPDKVPVTRRLVDGDVITGGDVTLEVIHTPGHTPGGICIYEPSERVLFTGDTVFAQGIGRTDLAGGDFQKLQESLMKLLAFSCTRPVEVVYPGHGPQADGDVLERVVELYCNDV